MYKKCDFAPVCSTVKMKVSFLLQNPQGNTVWLESIIAVPAESFTGDFLDTERVNGLSDYATQCGLNDYYISPEEEGFCRAAIVSLGADFNGGALECECNMEGSLDHSCAKIGGQCKCKENIMGRQCTRCKPGFFGYPDCKECNCPPTATCNEETGKEITVQPKISIKVFLCIYRMSQQVLDMYGTRISNLQKIQITFMYCTLTKYSQIFTIVF